MEMVMEMELECKDGGMEGTVELRVASCFRQTSCD